MSLNNSLFIMSFITLTEGQWAKVLLLLKLPNVVTICCAWNRTVLFLCLKHLIPGSNMPVWCLRPWEESSKSTHHGYCCLVGVYVLLGRLRILRFFMLLVARHEHAYATWMDIISFHHEIKLFLCLEQWEWSSKSTHYRNCCMLGVYVVQGVITDIDFHSCYMVVGWFWN